MVTIAARLLSEALRFNRVFERVLRAVPWISSSMKLDTNGFATIHEVRTAVRPRMLDVSEVGFCANGATVAVAPYAAGAIVFCSVLLLWIRFDSEVGGVC